MPRSEAQLRADYKYKKNHLHRVGVDFKNEYYDNILLPAAQKAGLPINTFIKQAIDEKIEKDGLIDAKSLPLTIDL